MSANLTRRRYPERPDCWHVCYGDVHVGTISIRSGVPFDVDQWEWTCGFYPGCEPGQHTNASAVDFEHARADFEETWQRLRTRTEAHFQEWRDARDWHKRKYAMWARGETVAVTEAKHHDALSLWRAIRQPRSRRQLRSPRAHLCKASQ